MPDSYPTSALYHTCVSTSRFLSLLPRILIVYHPTSPRLLLYLRAADPLRLPLTLRDISTSRALSLLSQGVALRLPSILG